MFDLFQSESPSEGQARHLANAIDRSTEMLKRNSREIREVFESTGYNFKKDKFISVVSSMFSMLIIDNIKRRSYYDRKEALSAFVSEVKKDYLLYADIEQSFETPISDREQLKREAARWAAKKYFEIKPTKKQADLFYERAQKFVSFINSADSETFE